MAASHHSLKRRLAEGASRKGGIRLALGVWAALLLGTGAAAGQITINTQTGVVTNNSTGEVLNTISRRYAQVEPTHVPLSDTRLDAKTRMQLIKALMAEQGFAMRPLPFGHAGLTLDANGGLTPAGQAYLDLVNSEGVSTNPGGRVVITDVKVEATKIIILLNGGPDLKHRFLRHIEIGGVPGPDSGDDGPPVPRSEPSSGQAGKGSRITLAFKRPLPELTGKEVEALLAPLISFGVKAPAVAFADTLPGPLKQAVLNHQVLVGMTTDMVFFAKGAPDQKYRVTEGQLPFEEWIYGHPPAVTEFVRINGNQVIRVEICKVGVKPVVYTKDEVSSLMEVSGLQPDAGHVEQLGDVYRDPAKEAPAPPPTLRRAGDVQPVYTPQRVEGPVRFPKQNPEDLPGYNPDGVPQMGTTQGAQTSGQGAQTASAPAGGSSGAQAAGAEAGQGQTGTASSQAGMAGQQTTDASQPVTSQPH
jgi:hypothetical protein